jgi:hypothetical protein
MGVWGPGVFENDESLDFLYDTVELLLNDYVVIPLASRKDTDDFLMEHGEHKLIPTIELYISLSEKLPLIKITLQKALGWRDEYLRAFDEETDMYPLHFKLKRREVIVRLFDRLISLAKE